MRGVAPVLKMCRALVAAGYDPKRPLHAFRGDTLALRVRSLGEGAALTMDEHHGPCFARWKPFLSFGGVAAYTSKWGGRYHPSQGCSMSTNATAQS